jgi:DNA-binding response OmpR family regulator
MSKKIYVVNATEELLALFNQILSAEGYEVVTQPFPLHSAERIIAAKPDLIVLDYITGSETDGWNALEMVKITDGLDDIPVLICDAPGERLKEMESFLKEKGVRVLLKPFDAHEFVASINEMMNDPQLRQISMIKADGYSDHV